MKKVLVLIVMLLCVIFAVSAYEMEPPGIVDFSGIMTQEAMPATEIVIPVDQPIGVAVATSYILNESMHRMEPSNSTLPMQSFDPQHGGFAVRLKFPLDGV